ncbi:uncharacterized protein SCHCODRAFT_02602078 [Schizophyllum commune H4-8]|uniref:N-acetyltransferase domain-containing protein n=1 Tax=Schizophyllum commune (strain H4-8 / FGSC 9210) TaxID=578458 RepID=D8QDL1_SCHCM|nr:uncharacterized protein SCHCODRAFT_02602078 [Schizophyllum commune H4-8]KAI5888677.1 hypothetical protein SCHCODRAFT_02602078 [Schizophyllum commune H4-8]
MATAGDQRSPMAMGEQHSPIIFSDRLVDQDERLDALFTMWEEAQVVCADLAARPEADLLSFAHEAAYFSVVDVKEGYLDLNGSIDENTTTATPANKQVPPPTRPQLKTIESLAKGKKALKANVATPRATSTSSAKPDVLSVVQDQDTQDILDELLELEGKRIDDGGGIDDASRPPGAVMFLDGSINVDLSSTGTSTSATPKKSSTAEPELASDASTSSPTASTPPNSVKKLAKKFPKSCLDHPEGRCNAGTDCGLQHDLWKCECGRIMGPGGQTAHRSSQKHLAGVARIEAAAKKEAKVKKEAKATQTNTKTPSGKDVSEKDPCKKSTGKARKAADISNRQMLESWGCLDEYDSPPPAPESRVKSPVGLVYLVVDAATQTAPDIPVTLNLGLYLAPTFRNQGLGQRVLISVLARAFEVMHAHRVQVRILGNRERHVALALFTKLGFAHEGTRRASFWSPLEALWRDETTMAILDTDWVMRPIRALARRGAPADVWEALVERHARYRTRRAPGLGGQEARLPTSDGQSGDDTLAQRSGPLGVGIHVERKDVAGVEQRRVAHVNEKVVTNVLQKFVTGVFEEVLGLCGVRGQHVEVIFEERVKGVWEGFSWW